MTATAKPASRTPWQIHVRVIEPTVTGNEERQILIHERDSRGGYCVPELRPTLALAKLIETRVNAHDELVAALREIEREASIHGDVFIRDKARAALAKVSE